MLALSYSYLDFLLFSSFHKTLVLKPCGRLKNSQTLCGPSSIVVHLHNVRGPYKVIHLKNSLKTTKSSNIDANCSFTHIG